MLNSSKLLHLTRMLSFALLATKHTISHLQLEAAPPNTSAKLCAARHKHLLSLPLLHKTRMLSFAAAHLISTPTKLTAARLNTLLITECFVLSFALLAS
jgi:hypothetical protein